MKTILCYGDSLTFGANPEGGRHPYEKRWPSVLGAQLGQNKVRIIAEGLGGRTTVFSDSTGPTDRNGAQILPTILGTHQPLDCVVIMLGTNDLRNYVCGNAVGIARGVFRLGEIIKTFPWGETYGAPEIVIVSPPHAVESKDLMLGGMFVGGPEISQQLAEQFELVAEELGAAFFDAANVALASPLDGIHLDAENTINIGKGLAPLVAKLLEI